MTQASGRQSTLSVGEVAARVGLTSHTLRWYEQEGLMAPVGRDSAGRRRYTGQDLSRLEGLRRTGMPVRDMRRYAELARQGEQTIAERLRLFEQHRRRVTEQIAQLQRDLDFVDYKISLYRKVAQDH